jgi:hypothetical protein
VDAIDVLTYGQRTVMATVRRFGPGDWDQIALGVWTAKDLLGHLGAFGPGSRMSSRHSSERPSRPT